MSESSQYIIPDLLATFPWKREANALLAEINDEANAWVASLALFDPDQLQKFQSWNFNLLGAHIAPIQDKEHLRLACDLMNFYFIFDEFSDVRNGGEVRKLGNGIMDAFRSRGGIQPTHDSKLTALAYQFIQRAVSAGGEDVAGMERFISDSDVYVNAVVLEAEDRVSGRLRTVNDYIILRRNTCAAIPTFTLLGLGLNIPNEVFEHPVMISLIENAADLVANINDMHSYGLECARGLVGHNIITALMKEYHLELQQALYWVSGYTFQTISNFLSNIRALPSWGENIDQAVKVYIDRVAKCVRGTESWSYETNRYYGGDASRVQESRRVTLLSNAGHVALENLQLEVVGA